MPLPPGYQLDNSPTKAAVSSNLPAGYILDPTGTVATPTDITTAIGAAGRGAASMIPLGTQALAATAGAFQKEPYLQERQEIEKEAQADIASHPIARIAGQAAGIAVPALVTGGSSAPESLLGAAGQGAAIGAGFGAGNAIDTLAGGGSGAQAAGNVALGAGLGAAGGAAGQALTGLAEKAVPGLEKYAATKATQSVGLGADKLGDMTPQELLDTGNMLLDKGIVKSGASTQEMFDQAKTLHEGYGDTIGQFGNQAKELGLSTDTKPLLAALDQKFQAADALQNPDERKAALFYKRGMADILAMSRQNLPETLAEVKGAPVPSDITFDQLQRLKKSYGNSAFENGMVKNPAAADVYSQLSAGQKDIINKVRSNPDLPAQLQDAMTNYSKLYPVVDGLQDVLGRERTGTVQPRAFGIVGKLAASMPGQQNPAINALTSLGLVGAGHPLWGVGAFTATLNNPKVMATAAQNIANAIPGVAGALPVAGAQVASSVTNTASAPTTINVNHPALAPWKPVFQKNAANAKDAGEVQKSNAVTDFILSQRDPAYSAAKQKMSDNLAPKSGQNPTGMAKGGMVPIEESKKMHVQDQKPVPMEDLPVNKPQTPHQPFNTDMADKLKAFLKGQKEKANVGS